MNENYTRINKRAFDIARATVQMSQGEVARAIGRTDSWLSKVLHGKLPCSKDMALRLANVLAVSVSDLFEDAQ